MKMCKVVSHAQALFRKSNDCEGVIDPTYEVITSLNSSCDNRCVKTSVVAVRDNSVELSKYKVSDFYLENLAAVGALGDAKRVTLNPTTMEMEDSVADAFDMLNMVADNNNVNNTNE